MHHVGHHHERQTSGGEVAATFAENLEDSNFSPVEMIRVLTGLADSRRTGGPQPRLRCH
jgi:hypothetical protein